VASSSNTGSTKVGAIIERHESDLLEDWLREQTAANTRRDDLIREGEVRDQSREFLGLFRQALGSGQVNDARGAAWEPVRNLLVSISRSRTQ
jgi:rsbT co-antagonist protein RsbR